MFEKNLKYYRLKKNMSKKELADSLGVSAMAISNYESGKRTPDIEMITKLAEILGIKITDFMATRNSDLVFQHIQEALGFVKERAGIYPGIG